MCGGQRADRGCALPTAADYSSNLQRICSQPRMKTVLSMSLVEWCLAIRVAHTHTHLQIVMHITDT